MTRAAMPASGGSFIRHPDGRLELVEGSITVPAEAAEPDAEPIPEALVGAARKLAPKAPKE